MSGRRTFARVGAGTDLDRRLQSARNHADHAEPGGLERRPVRYSATRRLKSAVQTGRLPTGVCRATDRPGVYDLVLGITPIRLIVINALDEHPRNAPWEIFAGELERSRYGLTHFQPRGALGQLLQHHLINAYRLEVPDMAYTVDDFMRDTLELIARDLAALTPELRAAALAQVDVEERLHGLTPEERLRGLAPEERLRGLDLEDRLRGLAAEERLRGLAPDERLRGLDPEDRLRGLDPELIKEWLKRSDH